MTKKKPALVTQALAEEESAFYRLEQIRMHSYAKLPEPKARLYAKSISLEISYDALFTSSQMVEYADACVEQLKRDLSCGLWK